MSSRVQPVVAVILLAACTRTPALSPRVGLGRPLTPDAVRTLQGSIFPSGAGLPVGHGTARQGRLVYEERCASCHGMQGEGSPVYPRLAGGSGTLATANPIPTAGSYWPYSTTVWEYIRRAMPYEVPGSLSANEVYAVTAFVLHLDRIVGEDEVMSETTLPRVRMPNRDGFIPDPRPDVTAR